MSALSPKVDIAERDSNVRFGPIPRHDPHRHFLRNQLLKFWLFRQLFGYPQTQLRNVEIDFGKSTFRSAGFATRWGGGSMSGQQVRHFVSDTTKAIIPLAAKARNLILYGKILFLAAFALLLSGIALPILFRANLPSATVNSTLNCYDSDGNYEPCVARTGASPSQFNGRTTGTHQTPSWTTTALYQQAIWSTTTVDQPASWTTSAVDQPENSTTSPPAARRSSTPGKRPACGRRLIPCFFSALRRGLTHIASVAAAVGQARTPANTFN